MCMAFMFKPNIQLHVSRISACFQPEKGHVQHMLQHVIRQNDSSALTLLLERGIDLNTIVHVKNYFKVSSEDNWSKRVYNNNFVVSDLVLPIF